MARIYYNTGGFGRAYSYLTLIKTKPDGAGLVIYGKDSQYKDINLNKDQILDLISKLETILGIRPDEPPIMTGDL